MHTIPINIQIKPEILLALNQTPDEFSNELLIWAAISLYYFNKVSLANAANFCGYHRYEFEKLLAKYNIPISKLDENDAIKELEILNNYKNVAHC